MAAYATPRLELASPSPKRPTSPTDPTRGIDCVDASSLLDVLLDQLAERVADRLATAAHGSPVGESAGQEWFDSRHAADYLGVHRDTLRKLAAERAIPSEQDGPNCKLYFRRSELDAWRRSGGRPRHIAATIQRAA